jgi:poly(A) polymerase/tRNA nucleotidyltransferase (CCA-adding enzyme)
MRIELNRTQTDRILADTFGPSVYIIGGPVRDKLRSLLHGVPFEPKDHDYVIVGVSLDQVREKLGDIARIDAVGASFGVLKVTVPGEATVDVALPRRERSTGWGHRQFEVQSGPDVTIAEDQARRDFRMNAVAVQLVSGELITHPGAIEDIRDKRIAAINGRQSFLDDPLRMLRAAQFAARFGFQIDDETLGFMRGCSPLARTVSSERIYEELCKMLVRSERPSEGVRILYRTDLLAATIPGLEEGAAVEQNSFHAFDVLEHNLAALDASKPTLEARWAALLHDIGKPRTRSREKGRYGYTFYDHENVGAEMSQQVLRHLRCSNLLAERVTRLVTNHMYLADPTQSESTIKRFINRIGPELLDEQFHLRHADKFASGLPQGRNLESNERFERRVYEILAKQPPLEIRDLAVNGHDVMQAVIEARLKPAGFTPGAEVGQILRELRDRVIDVPEMNVRDRLRVEMMAIIERMKAT